MRYSTFDFSFLFVLVNMKKYEKAHGSFERALDHAKSLGMRNFNIF